MVRSKEHVIERLQTGVCMERRVLKVLRSLATYYELTLGDFLEGIVLHAFEGKCAFGQESLQRIKELKSSLVSSCIPDRATASAKAPWAILQRRNQQMNQRRKQLAISGLQWTLGLVVLLESAHFALLQSAGREFAKTGLAPWIRPALGWSEMVAALLFLVPATSLVGGYLLLLTFAIGVAIHLLIGELPGVGSLIIYGMAVVACMTHRNKQAVEVPHD
jgi:hypothetical protein